jgi:hypothetical protein
MSTVDSTKTVNVTEAEVRHAIAAILPALVRDVTAAVVAAAVNRAIKAARGRVD